MVQWEPFFGQQKNQIVDLAAKQRLPSISGYDAYAEAGGLMSYGQANTESVRRLASYIDKILKGTKPGNLPIELPTKFEFALNMKTAKALGIKIPNSSLVQATKTIE